ncbi:phosphatase PAP2 family protein [Pengzhenrongella frigida]|uniref:phosphatase PAP2 family protein n=1 Tax=Pengzhenrongella frigida TaxID=1259133 RepID=UPI001F5DBECC|nr:phosphatase PAP2 family protein [Cellulomonas sp. HLT2-17]
MSTTGPVTAPLPVVVPAPAPKRVSRLGVALGITTAVLATLGVWLTWRVFVASAAGQRVDQAAFEGAEYGRNRLWQVAEPVLEVVSIPYVAVVLVAAVIIAVVRRRGGLALQVALLVAGANITTQVLKNVVFDRPDLDATPVFANALPSGHTTAAASVSAALVFVVPPRARPWAAVLGAVYTSATGISTLVGGWHRPGDVVAGVLVVLAWSGLACALASASRPRGGPDTPSTATGQLVLTDPARTSRSGRRRASMVGVGGGLLLLAAAAAAVPAAYGMYASWTTAGDLDSRAELLVAYAGGASGVVAMSCLTFAVLLAVRQAAGRVG